MTSGGAEALKAAIRRSLPIIISLTLLGIVAVNVFKHLQGSRYQASSQVEVVNDPLSSIITNTQPGFVDPQRSQDTAVALAGSPQVYQLAARHGMGAASTLQNATSVSGIPDTDIIQFSATSSSAHRAVAISNGVANAYVAFRAQLSAGRITQTMSRLQKLLTTLPPGSARAAQARTQLNQLELLQGVGSSDSQLVQRATSADQTSPSPVKDSLLGLSVGLIIALIVVAVREAVDTAVRSEADVEEVLSVPVLASVRSLPRRARIVTYGRHEGMFGDTYALLAAQLPEGADGREGLVLAVTSAVAREGKTTTAANLAVAAARRGATVALADFDFRKPALSDLFDIPREATGALQILDGAAELDETLWHVPLEGARPVATQNGARLTAGERAATRPRRNGTDGQSGGDGEDGNLWILPSGGTVSSLRATRQAHIGSLLRELHAKADLVILDTPPALLTVEMTELSRMIDLVLVVVRQGRISQRSLRSLRRQVRGWSAELAGAVLTDVPAAGEYSSYYYKAQ